jgi:hypothetical protein
MSWLSKIGLSVSFFVFIFLNTIKGNDPCNSSIPVDYLPYGEQFTINVTNVNPAIAYIPLMHNAMYRLVFCSSDLKKYKVELFDIEKKLLFSTVCENYVTNINVTFNNPVTCYVVVSLYETKQTTGSVKFTIVYKELSKEIEIKK